YYYYYYLAVNQILEKVSSKPVNTNLNQNNSNISTQNGIDEDADGSEVSIVGYLKAKPIKFQTLDELLKNFPSVRAALYKKRTATLAATSTETITSHLSSLQITPQSTQCPIQSTKSAWRTRRTYALIGTELSLVQSILIG
ncbi:unnamed protein product, partial [Rotaria magnacalcarata]